MRNRASVHYQLVELGDEAGHLGRGWIVHTAYLERPGCVRGAARRRPLGEPPGRKVLLVGRFAAAPGLPVARRGGEPGQDGYLSVGLLGQKRLGAEPLAGQGAPDTVLVEAGAEGPMRSGTHAATAAPISS